MEKQDYLKKLFMHAIDVHIYEYLPEEYKKNTYTGGSIFESALKDNFQLDKFIKNFKDFKKTYFTHLNIKKINSKISRGFDLFVLYKVANSLLKNYTKLVSLNPHLSIEKIAYELNTNVYIEDIEAELALFSRGYEQKLIELEEDRKQTNKKRSESALNRTDKNEPYYIRIIEVMDKLSVNLKTASEVVCERLKNEHLIKEDLSHSFRTQIVSWAKKQINRDTSNKETAIKFLRLHNPALLKSLTKESSQVT